MLFIDCLVGRSMNGTARELYDGFLILKSLKISSDGVINAEVNMRTSYTNPLYLLPITS